MMAAYVLLWIAGSRWHGLAMLAAFVYPLMLLVGMQRPSVVAALGPVAGNDPDTAALPVRRPWHLRFTLWRLVAIMTALSVVLAGVTWWTRHPVRREVIKLKYGNYEVRKSACAQLGGMASDAEDAVPHLIALLNEPAGPRGSAAFALLEIGTIPAMIAVLEYDFQQYGCSAALSELALSLVGSMGPKAKDATPVLIKILESPKLHLSQKEPIVRTLGQIGPDARSAIPALVKYGNDHGARSRVLSNALLRIGLERVPKQTNTEPTSLSFTQSKDFTDAEAARLQGWTRLQELWLRGTQITDAGLRHLGRVRSLTKLYLHDTQITDAGLAHLKGLSNLRALYLPGSQVTDEGVKQLQEALPNCEIHH
jgi:hypothetical protein